MSFEVEQVLLFNLVSSVPSFVESGSPSSLPVFICLIRGMVIFRDRKVNIR